ncbi:MAG: excinuclease ABC subunit UvrC [Desulfurivibrionaceae bacterium]|nr:excinuclease ABC subunit UvrC [Desulfurivibrionaceae bacterium]
MTPPRKSSESPVTPAFLRTVPHRPGVYLMKDGLGKILYVGKARDLRNRLASYRGAEAGRFSKTAVMLAKAVLVETILTATEKEALILEASLIKKHRPRYNVILRDDKNYPYLKVTVNEKWPRLVVCRRRRKDGARYFGPYANPAAMRDTLALLRELFPLRTCKGPHPKKLQRPCLNEQIGRCPAPCCDLADRQAYLEATAAIVAILEGKKSELAGYLKERMDEAAKGREYERAAFFRDRLGSLQKTLESQAVAAGHTRNQDVFGLIRRGLAAAVSIIYVRDGLVSGQQSFFMETVLGDDGEVMKGCLQQFYGDERNIPPEILLSTAPANIELLGDWLAELRGGVVQLKVPRRGKPAELVLMAGNNAEQLFADEEQKSRSNLALLTAVATTLKLQKVPRRIECLDISNIGGKQAVGSLICFKEGEPDKKSYRHYRITGGDTPDDYAMMSEVLHRRFAPDKEGELPDLLLVDGGKGQLNVAVQILAETGRLPEVESAAIAKEKKQEGEKLFRPGRKNPILLPGHSPVLLFLMRVRDESHRFGIDLHRRLRGKATLQSGLDRVPGIGPARRRRLLRKFGSLKRIKAASGAELMEVEGVGAELAMIIREHLGSD